MIAPDVLLARLFEVNRPLTDEDSPRTIAKWDSLAHMTMILELEREYDVSIDPGDALELKSVGDVKRLLREYGVTA